ncbi:hypothetical protein OAC51_06355 [Flavobacteriaceae bacterium]|nr:hypothetical protein [Flavobacteriaceae bacterium]
MKIKYRFIFLFLSTNCSSDLEYLEKFKGYNSNPRVVETKTFILEKGGNIEKERNNAPKKVIEFDKEGRIIKLVQTKADDKNRVYSEKYIYHINGRVKQMESTRSYDSQLDKKTNYLYNKKNQLIRLDVNNGKVVKQYFYRNGNLIKETVKATFKNFYYMEYSYDNKNRKIGIKSFNKDGEFKNMVKYYYDKNQNISKSELYYEEEKLNSFFIFIKDSYGNTTESKEYSAQNLDTTLIVHEKTSFIYDNKNNIVKSTVTSNNSNNSLFTENTYSYWK